MGTVALNNLKPRKLAFNKMSMGEWERFNRYIEKHIARNYADEAGNLYKQNYIRAIKDSFGESSNLIGLVEQINGTDLFYNSLTNPYLTVSFVYVEGDEDMERISDKIGYELNLLLDK